jgi:hypothetical protein
MKLLSKFGKVLEVTGETVLAFCEFVFTYWQVFAVAAALLLVLEVHQLRRDIERALEQAQTEEVSK